MFFRNAVNAGLPAMTVPGVTEAFSDGDIGTFDLGTGEWHNDTTGAGGTVPVLPDLILDILAGGGVLPGWPSGDICRPNSPRRCAQPRWLWPDQVAAHDHPRPPAAQSSCR